MSCSYCKYHIFSTSLKPSIEKITKTGNGVFLCKDIKLPVFDSPFHYHPESELTYVSSSFGQRVVGDHFDSFKPNDLVLYGSNLPHVYYNDPKNSNSPYWAQASLLQFQKNCLGTEFHALEEMNEITDLNNRANRGIRFLKKKKKTGGNLLKQLVGQRGSNRIISFIGLLDYLARQEEYEYLASLAYCPLPNPKHEGRINRCIAYMYDHLHEELRLPKVASLASMSPESFSRFFKKTTGKTFIGFLNELRISNACWYLQQSDRTITEICFACGFSNLSNFNRRFRGIKNMTPTKYRKNSSTRPN